LKADLVVAQSYEPPWPEIPESGPASEMNFSCGLAILKLLRIAFEACGSLLALRCANSTS